MCLKSLETISHACDQWELRTRGKRQSAMGVHYSWPLSNGGGPTYLPTQKENILGKIAFIRKTSHSWRPNGSTSCRGCIDSPPQRHTFVKRPGQPAYWLERATSHLGVKYPHHQATADPLSRMTAWLDLLWFWCPFSPNSVGINLLVSRLCQDRSLTNVNT